MSLKIVKPAEFFCESTGYIIEGVTYPRVTQIKGVIKNLGLVNWQVSIGRKKSMEIMKKRGEFGTRVHRLIKLSLEGETIDAKKYGEETETTMQKFDDFCDEYKIQPELLEQNLWSEKYKYAGTADYVGYVDDKLMILDWKTSKAIYDEYWLQLAAYIWALEELTGERADCGILQIRDGKKKFVTKTYDEMMEEFEIFKAALVIYNRYRVKK